ncbi:MAG: ABC transporter ATP-binding protein [Desulfitobacteriia bacterium]|jgi:taurine transport system ATP-binding protein
MSYLIIQSLHAGYEQNEALTLALQDVNLALDKGSSGALIGPSGSGKSTLLNVLAGLHRNYQGQVLLDGKKPANNPETALILQEYGLLPWKTVWDNVGLGLQIKGIGKAEAEERVAKILGKLGLLPLRKRFPTQLSGGQRQRVAIARSLVLEPKLLLMDEPFSSLDALTREEMQDLVLELWQDTQLTIFFVTHNIEEAVFLGQKIFVMSGCPGTIVREFENPLAGDISARGKLEFLETAGSLRLSLRGGDKVWA